MAFSQILPDEKKESAVAFLKATVAYYANLGVTIARVMTDNGSCYRSQVFRQACRDLASSTSEPSPIRPRQRMRLNSPFLRIRGILLPPTGDRVTKSRA